MQERPGSPFRGPARAQCSAPQGPRRSQRPKEHREGSQHSEGWEAAARSGHTAVVQGTGMSTGKEVTWGENCRTWPEGPGGFLDEGGGKAGRVALVAGDRGVGERQGLSPVLRVTRTRERQAWRLAERGGESQWAEGRGQARELALLAWPRAALCARGGARPQGTWPWGCRGGGWEHGRRGGCGGLGMS